MGLKDRKGNVMCEVFGNVLQVYRYTRSVLTYAERKGFHVPEVAEELLADGLCVSVVRP